MTGLTTQQAADRLGMTPAAFRKYAWSSADAGAPLTLPRDDWPDRRTPLYSPALLGLEGESAAQTQGLTTAEAAKLAGMKPNSFRKWASRLSKADRPMVLPKERWPDGRTPLWDADLVGAELAARPGKGFRAKADERRQIYEQGRLKRREAAEGEDSPPNPA